MTTRITYIGHATLLIELDGVRFLTDPLLTQWVGPLRRQWPPVDQAWTRDIDVVLLSHLHHDHFHLPSLARVDPEARLVVPSGSGSYLRSRGWRNIDEVSPIEEFTVGNVDVQVVPALHGPTRPLSRLVAEPQGFVLRGSQTIYFAGDTDIFSEMDTLVPDLDVALVPIWGWGPTLGEGHLDPARAAEAVKLLKPRIAIPIHWGTFFPVGLPWRRAVLGDTARAFSVFTTAIAPAVDVRIVEPGKSISISSKTSS